MAYRTFDLQIEAHVAQVIFNRPDKANSLNELAWQELKAIFEDLDQRPEVRAIVLRGYGKHFCAGIDLELLGSVFQRFPKGCEGRKRETFRKFLLELQAAINAIEECRKPVLAAIHNGCIGGGLDIVSACDMRYCSGGAVFSIKEIDVGLVADVGSLQRLPYFIGEGMVREMAYTGRNVAAAEAKEMGLVNRVYETQTDLMTGVSEIAQAIAAKPPLAVRGIKANLAFGRDHSVREGLNYAATWNGGMMSFEDIGRAIRRK